MHPLKSGPCSLLDIQIGASVVNSGLLALVENMTAIRPRFGGKSKYKYLLETDLKKPNTYSAYRKTEKTSGRHSKIFRKKRMV